MILKYLEQPQDIPLSYLCNHKAKRRFIVKEDIFVTLSDGYELFIEEGYETDLMSVPAYLWSIIRPFDKALIGDIIHDKLWTDKQKQFKHFEYNVYKSRLFADEERMKWRNSIAPELKIKNYITHKVIRIVGGLFYSKQLLIPN